MAWQEAEGTKPPLEYNEDEDKSKISKEVLASEEIRLRKEIKGSTLKQTKEQPYSKTVNPNIIFDSSKDNK